MKSTLKLFAAALVLSAGAVPERAFAARGYTPPHESDSNSLRTGGTQMSNGRKKRSGTAVASARSGKDCGYRDHQDAESMSTASSIIGTGTGFIPVPGVSIAGTIISTFLGLGSTQSSTLATVKWQRCVEKQIAKIGDEAQASIAQNHKETQESVTRIGEEIGQDVAEISSNLDAKTAVFEQRIAEQDKRIAVLELQAAATARAEIPVHQTFPTCVNCGDVTPEQMPLVPETKPEEPVPEAQTSQVPQATPAAPASAPKPVEKEIIPPMPIRKKLPELLPGQEYARSSSGM
jgi:hypothetical protein